MTAATGQTEPEVLAGAKQRLFPDDGDDGAYAVADTQFAREQWIDAGEIDAEVRRVLAPFNHVRVGSGYPDLVGVRDLENDLVAVDRLGDDPPLVAVEAKGYTADGTVDVERGIVQAHDRLGEANVAFVAAPRAAISQSARAMATELNVGVLGVRPDGEVAVVETPRVVGNRATDAATAIRFQASAQGVADKNFGLNHPKNYLAYPLAVAHDGDAEALIADRVVGAVDAARTGAAFLGLIDERPVTRGPDVRLTELGREVVRFARQEHGDVDRALDEFERWKGSTRRFRDAAPKWGLVARRVVYDYAATELIVTELQQMHDDGIESPSLVDLVAYLHRQHPTFTVELFLKSDEDVRRRALSADGDLRREPLREGGTYHSPTVFQLKAMWYHAGVLAERGAEPSRLDPTADEWALRDPIGV